MNDRHRILARLRDQRRLTPARRKHEIVYEGTSRSDVGQIIYLEHLMAPLRIKFFRFGVCELLNPDLYRVIRRGNPQRQVHANNPQVFQALYFHDVYEVEKDQIIGEIVTRLFRSPCSRGNQWALTRIKFRDQIIYELPAGAI